MQGQFCLLLDGFVSYIKYDFVEFAQNNRIILFSFLPHTTHLLQPLDVVCFQPFKHYHSEAIDVAVRTGDTDFSKIEFLAAFEGFHKQTFKQSTILSAFRKTGILPYNPKAVLDPLKEQKERARLTELALPSKEEEEVDSERPITPTNTTEM
jgi:DDE superfamily endonuclease